jgi:PhnB protein
MGLGRRTAARNAAAAGPALEGDAGDAVKRDRAGAAEIELRAQEINMQFAPLLNFKGECEAAFKFYERVFGGKIESMSRFEGSPMADRIPAEWRNKILHASLVAEGQTLMGSDPPPDRYRPPQGFSVALDFKDPAKADQVFKALAENGKVEMPMQETFWALRFGHVIDRFGIPWMINCMRPS